MLKKLLTLKLLYALAVPLLIVLLSVAAVTIITGVTTATNAANAANTPGACAAPAPVAAGDVAVVAGSAPGLSPTQLAAARIITGVAVSRGLGKAGVLVMLTAAYTESTLNPRAVDPSGRWYGLFQMSDAWGPLDDRYDPQKASTLFIDGGQGGQPGLLDVPNWASIDPADAAEGVEQAGRGGDNYRVNVPAARAIMDSLLAGQTVPQGPTGGSRPVVDGATCVPPAGGAGGELWDPGKIFSDDVFYNAQALPSEQAVQGALDKVGATCLAVACLRNDTYTIEGLSAPFCQPVPAEGPARYARVLRLLAQACGLNPQVAITMIQKESQGLTKPSPPAALTGFGCPDTGPGGSANCDPNRAGVWAQTAGMFSAFAAMRQDNSRVARYIEGQSHNILWNVEESGCGAAPVTVANRATASLYTYTPYQPNQAAIDAYPGVGDDCSAYGNRNVFFLFQKYFGPTGGGRPAAQTGAGSVVANGPKVTIPRNQYVASAVQGVEITAPTAAMAKGIAAGFGALGLPYVWGGGGSGQGPNNGCARGGGDYNSCGSEIGFDCSGLTAYVLAQGGVPSPIPGSSGEQRASGQSVPYEQGLPGDIVGFPGHVAVYLGVIGGTPYILEASWVGTPVHVVPLTRGDRDGSLHRLWVNSTP